MAALLDRRAEKRVETIAPQGISQNPSQPLIDALGGLRTAAGVSVTESTAQNLPAVFACDKVLKESVAQCTIRLMRRNADGQRVAAEDRPEYTVLHDLANPAMSAFEWVETAQGHVNLWGNHYSELERNKRGEVVAAWPLDPSRMAVDLNGLNQIRYTYRMASGKKKEWIFDPALPPVFHLRSNSFDGLRGRSPVQMLRESLGVSAATEKYRGKFFSQGGHGQLHLTTPKGLTPDAAKRVRADYEAVTVGDDNWHRVVILDHDLKPVPISMPLRDMQLLELEMFSTAQIAGAYRVPLMMISNTEKVTTWGSGIEALQIGFVTYALMPHFVRWQQAIARDFFGPRGFNIFSASFVVDSLLRGDLKARNEALQLQRQNGVINANDWRKLIDYDGQIAAIDGGDDYLVNGNMVPLRRDPAAMIDGLPAAKGAVN